MSEIVLSTFNWDSVRTSLNGTRKHSGHFSKRAFSTKRSEHCLSLDLGVGMPVTRHPPHSPGRVVFRSAIP